MATVSFNLPILKSRRGRKSVLMVEMKASRLEFPRNGRQTRTSK